MKRILALTAAIVVVAAAVGIAWALWQASSTIHTSIQVSSPPSAAIVAGTGHCDDDGSPVPPAWDSTDVVGAGDPAGRGPNSPRYDKDISSCTATVVDGVGQLTLSSAYADLYSMSFWGLKNPVGSQSWVLASVEIDGAALDDCPNAGGTMTTVDLDGNTQPDVEACITLLPNYMTDDEAAALGTTWAAGDQKDIAIKLQILDTVTAGITHTFDITFNGQAQTGGP
jgi:hypothetical protein